jgi:hypothetical protein
MESRYSFKIIAIASGLCLLSLQLMMAVLAFSALPVNYAIAQMIPSSPPLNTKPEQPGRLANDSNNNKNITSSPIENLINATTPKGPPTPTVKESYPSYIATNRTNIQAHSNGSIAAVCDIGDALGVGGYSIGNLTSPEGAASQIFIYANHPLSDFGIEGWVTGLLNNRNEPVTLNAIALCLNLNRK